MERWPFKMLTLELAPRQTLSVEFHRVQIENLTGQGTGENVCDVCDAKKLETFEHVVLQTHPGQLLLIVQGGNAT